MKNRIVIAAFFVVAFVSVIQSFDWDRDFYEAHIQTPYEKIQKNQRERANLLQYIERDPASYEGVLKNREILARKKYPDFQTRYDIADKIRHTDEHYLPGVGRYVSKSFGLKPALRGYRYSEPYRYAEIPTNMQQLPDIKEMIKQDIQRKSIRNRFSNWLSSWYR